LRDKYDIDKVVYVADSGMFNKSNLKELDELEEYNFDYIVGARIKNLSKSIKIRLLMSRTISILMPDFDIGNFYFRLWEKALL